eukprot:335739-Chlamydomonas_euryale.AAC.3
MSTRPGPPHVLQNTAGGSWQRHLATNERSASKGRRTRAHHVYLQLNQRPRRAKQCNNASRAEHQLIEF